MQRLTLALAAFGVLLFGHSAQAVDGNWNTNAAGNWSAAANWTSNPSVPDGAGSTVGLTFDISATRTITIDTTSRTVGTLNIGDPTAAISAYTLAANGGASLIMDNGGAGAVINHTATGGADIISAPISLNDNLTVNNASASALTLSGGITGAGAITNSGAGAGGTIISGIIGSGVTGVTQNSATTSLTLSVANAYTGTTNIPAGTLYANNATALGTSSVILGDTAGINPASLLLNAGTLANNVTIRAGSAGGIVLGELATGNTSNGYTYSGNITLNRNVWLANGLTGGGGGFFSGNITDAAGTSNAVSLIAGSAAAATFQNISGAGNSYSGGTTVDGNLWSVAATSRLGTGNVVVNAGGLRLGAATNVASGKTVTVNNGGLLSLSAVFDPTGLIASASSGALGIEVAAYSTRLNMANIGNGLMFLGGNSNNTAYTATGLDANSDGNYRLGAGGGTGSTTALKISGTDNVITGGTAALTVGSSLANAPYSKGNGWVVLSNANNYGGGTTVNPASGLEGTAKGTGTATTTPFGSTTAAVTLHGGVLQLDAFNTGQQNITPVGAVTFEGKSTLAVNNANAWATTLNAAGLTRSNRGVLVIQAVNAAANLGAADPSSTTTKSENVTVTATGGDNPTVTAGMVQPYYVSATGSFLNYGANGFVPAATAAMPTSGVTATNASSGAVALLGDTTVNSLVLSGALTTTTTNKTLTITSGGLSFAASAAIGSTTANQNVNLAFGGEALLFASGGATGTLNNVVSGTGGLTVSGSPSAGGPGNITLGSTANTFSGQVTINQQSQLNIPADGSLGTGAGANNGVLINGGALSVTASGVTLASGRDIAIGACGGTISNSFNPGAINITTTIASKITGGNGAFLNFTGGGNKNSGNVILILTNTNNDFTAPIYLDSQYGVPPLLLSIDADAELGNSGNSITISNLSVLQQTGITVTTNRAIRFINQGGTIDVKDFGTYTVGGVISGDGNLTKTSSGIGSGVLKLTAANTLTGNTLVNGGAVLLGHANALQFSTVSLGAANGLTFDSSLSPHTFTIGGLGGSAGELLNDGTNAVTLQVGNNNANINYSGALGGNGALTKIGAGTQTLSGTNNYGGATTVGSGTLQFAKRVSLYNNAHESWTAANITVAPAATAAFNVGGAGEFDSSDIDILLAPAFGTTATTGFKSGSSLGLDTTNAGGGNFICSSIIVNPFSGANTLGLTKLGANTLTLSGASTYTGPTIIQNGILSASSLNKVSGGSVSSNLGAPTTVANGTIAIGGNSTAAQLTYVGSGETTDRVIDLAGAAGGAVIDQSGTGLLKFTSALTATGAGSKTLTLQGSSAGAGEIGGAIVDNSSTNKTSLTKAGTGVWTLSGASTYSGGTTVNAGTLILGNPSALGNVNNTLTVNAPATGSSVLDLHGYNLGVGILSGTTAAGAASIVNNGTGTATLTIGNGNTGGVYGNVISDHTTGAGTVALAKAGTATATLIGVNTYTGATTVGGGTLALSGVNGSAANSDITAMGVPYTGLSTLNLDSSAAGVAGTTRAKSVTLKGGALTVGGNNTANSNDTVTNAITIDGASANAFGISTITLTSGATKTTTLTAASLTHANGGVVQLVGGNLGAAPGSNVQNFIVGTAPTGTDFVGGAGGAGSTTLKIVPWALFGASVGSTSVTDFVTYDTNGFRPLSSAAGEYAAFSDGNAVGNTTDNVRITTPGTVTATSTTTVNSLILNGGGGAAINLGAVAGTGTVNVTSGAVLLMGSNSSPNINTNLNFGTAQGVITAQKGKGSQINGAIGGSGGLVITQPGFGVNGSGGTSVALGGVSNTSAYTGNTYILARLDVGSNNFLPNGSRTGDVYVDGLIQAGSITINGLNGNGIVSRSAGSAATLTLGDNNASGTFTGAINLSGTGGATLGITKIGNGTQILSGSANTYAGPTIVNGGVLSIDNVIDGPIQTTISGVASASTITVGSNAGLVVGQAVAGTQIGGGAVITDISGTTITLSSTNQGSGGPVSGIGNFGFANGLGLSSNAASNLVLNGGTLKYTGAATSTNRQFSVGTGNGTIDASGTGALNLTNTGSMGFNSQTGTRTLTLAGTNTGNNTLAAAVGDNGGATSLTKAGTGAWILSGASTYSGATAVNAGTLLVGANAPSGSAGALGNATSAILVGDTTGGASAALLTNGGFTVGRDIDVQAGSGTVTLGGNAAAASSFTGNVTLNRDVILTAANGGTADFGGAWNTGGMNINVTGAGSSVVSLSSPLNTTGAINVNSGALDINGTLTSGEVTNASSFVVTATGNATVDGLSGAGATTVNGILTADSIVQGTLSIGAGGVVTIRETTGGNVSSVPEPSTFVLLGVGAIGLLAYAWRRRKTTA